MAGIADLANSCATQYVRSEAPVFVLETVESVVGSVNEATKDNKPTPTVTAKRLPEHVNEVLRDLHLV